MGGSVQKGLSLAVGSHARNDACGARDKPYSLGLTTHVSSVGMYIFKQYAQHFEKYSMKTRIFSFMLALVALVGSAHASVISFEGATTYGSAVMPGQYGGWVWNGFGLLNQVDYIGTGYANRAGSGDFYAYNLSGERRVGFGTANHEFVTLNSIQFSSYLDEFLNLSINGRSQTGDWYQRNIQVGLGMETIYFDWQVDRIEIFATSLLGSHIWGDPTKFFMDNLAFNESPANAVSEPSSLNLLLVAAMCLLGSANFRRHVHFRNYTEAGA